MTHPNADKEPKDRPTVPPTLDSFDPLRDAETLLEEDTPLNPESVDGGADPGNGTGDADTAERKDGPEGTNEDEARFDAG